ncbi:MAG TPA: ATP-binding protein, partial [Gammaproteobacteria bacterium]|nr:ATP-binding protein [Gammaproteobacteria bacterium]
DLVQIFDRYYRGASSKGAGIGLALVKRICDRYGWHITIDSAEGQGATVRLSFDARGGRGARAREPVGAQPVGLS